jgi:alkaline phosphatase
VVWNILIQTRPTGKMIKRLRVAFPTLLALGLGLALLPGCRTHTRPLSIILMISDGCGYNCFDLASFYQHGRLGAQVYDSFPIRLAVSTHSASGIPYDPGKAWASFDFVLNDPTDSAAAATALATGIKTRDDVIGLSLDGVRLRNIIDVAESSGKKTGTVTSVPFCHATPAGFIAHAVSRYMYEDIARQIIMESPVDVVMGCGHPGFDKFGRPAEKANFRYVGGEETWQALVQGKAGADADGDGRPDPWTLAETAEALPALSAGPIPSRLFFIAPVFRTLQQERAGDALADPFDVPLLQTVPTLEKMALAALNILDTDPDGFFLMIEGGPPDRGANLL